MNSRHQSIPQSPTWSASFHVAGPIDEAVFAILHTPTIVLVTEQLQDAVRGPEIALSSKGLVYKGIMTYTTGGLSMRLSKGEWTVTQSWRECERYLKDEGQQG